MDAIEGLIYGNFYSILYQLKLLIAIWGIVYFNVGYNLEEKKWLENSLLH